MPNSQYYTAILIFGESGVDTFLKEHRGEARTADEWIKLISGTMPEHRTAALPLNAIRKSFATHEQMLAYAEGVHDSSDGSITDILTEGITDSLQYDEEPESRLARSLTEAEHAYRDYLLSGIKRMLGRLLEGKGTRTLNIDEVVSDGFFDRIGKYACPKDYPGNYLFKAYGLDADGSLFVEAGESSDDSSYTLSQYELEPEELRDMYDDLKVIEENVFDKGVFEVEEGTGRVVCISED